MTPAPIPPFAAANPRRRLERILVFLFCLLVGLPLVQQLTGLVRAPPLAGVEVKAPRPVFSSAAWFDGSYAAAMEKRQASRLGFRGVLVRLACQANYSLFGRFYTSDGTEVVQGRDHWLFVRPDVKWAVRQPAYPEKKAALFAEKAARLHQALAARGIAFAVVLAPSKSEFVPEKLPPDIALPPRDPAGAAPRLLAEMTRQDVPLLDGDRLFLSLKDREPFLFPPTGLHWSHAGAWHAWQALARLLREQPACPPLPESQPVRRIVWSPPRGADSDLRALLNLWRFEPGGPVPLPYPLVEPPPPDLRNRHAALVCGDSFAYALIDGMARSGAFRQVDLLYYFKRHYAYPALSFEQTDKRLISENGLDRGPLPAAGPDWNVLLENRQFVLLVLNVTHIRDEGWGFVDSLLTHLNSQRRGTAFPGRVPD